MIAPDEPLEILMAPAGGWCDPVTGACRIDLSTEAEHADDSATRVDRDR